MVKPKVFLKGVMYIYISPLSVCTWWFFLTPHLKEDPCAAQEASWLHRWSLASC